MYLEAQNTIDSEQYFIKIEISYYAYLSVFPAM